MLTNIILALALNSSLASVHANEATEPGNSFKPKLDTRPLTLSEGMNYLDRIYREADLGAPPEKARAYLRELVTDGVSAERLKAYAASFKFNLQSKTTHGPGLSPRRAHMHAVEVSQRRKTVAGVEFEIRMFGFLLESLLEDARGDEEKTAVASIRALDLAGEVEPRTKKVQGKASTTSSSIPVPMDLALEIMRRHYREVGADEVPSYARTYAVRWARRLRDEGLLAKILEAYGDGLKFAAKPKADLGLGLSLSDAHLHALDMYDRRRTNVSMEVEAFEAAYAKLVASAEDHGFAMDPEQARAFALALVRQESGRSVREITDYLYRRRLLRSFMGKPIRQGGLAYSANDTDALIQEWETRLDSRSKVDQFIMYYEITLASHLAKVALDGIDDDVRARDLALDWMQSTDDPSTIYDWLKANKYPDVRLATLDAYVAANRSRTKILFKRASRCIRALTSGLGR